MLKVFKSFEKWVVITLGISLGLFITVSVLELVYLIIKQLVTPDQTGEGVILNLMEIKNFLGLFFNVLIAFELFETIRVYLKENVFHAEYIVLVGIIAVGRKVVLWDYEQTEALKVFGLAAVIIALSISYYLLKKSNTVKHTSNSEENSKEENEH